MDRRTVLTGGAAALLGAIGVGRVLTQASEPAPSALPAAEPTTRPSPGTPSPTTSAASAPSPSPTTEPAPATSPSPADEPEAAPEPSPTGQPTTAAAALVVPVLCRDAWRAAPAGEGLVEHTLARMTVHHTAVPLGSNADAPGRLRQHQGYHQSQGWPDIAYHLGVDRRGNVYELRTIGARGDTFTDYDPSGHLLILAEGDFDQQQPTDEQLEGVATLLAWGASAHGLPIDTVGGHRDHASTSCPGDALYARLPDLRRRAVELAARGVSTRSVCGDEGRATVARIESGEDG